MAAGRGLWRTDGWDVVLVCPRELVLWELCELGAAVLGLPLAGLMCLLGPGSWTLYVPLAVFSCLGLIWNGSFWYSLGVVRERVRISPQGVRIMELSGRSLSFRWGERPAFESIDPLGNAQITTRRQRVTERYRFGYLPMSLTQLSRLLEVFSSCGGIRTRLEGDDPLGVVLGVLEPSEHELAERYVTWAPSPADSGAVTDGDHRPTP